MRVYLIILLCFVFTGLVSAQVDELTPYEVALERIAEAEESGATVLDLSNIGLTELPPEIGNLNNLEVLALWANYLTTLPPEIGQLSNLQWLGLGINQLTTLPPEIGQLSNLQEIILWQNQLTSLPSEVGNLHNLEKLNLWQNQLTTLPPEIGQLSNLRELVLDTNQLSSLPPEIGQLKALCILDIDYNQLRRLPHQVGQLTLFESDVSDCPFNSGLYLEGNPLISPPDEVLAQGTEAILAYLRNPLWWHLQEVILGVASCIGVLMSVVLILNWRNRREKRKRKPDAL